MGLAGIGIGATSITSRLGWIVVSLLFVSMSSLMVFSPLIVSALFQTPCVLWYNYSTFLYQSQASIVYIWGIKKRLFLGVFCRLSAVALFILFRSPMSDSIEITHVCPLSSETKGSCLRHIEPWPHLQSRRSTISHCQRQQRCFS